MKTRFMLIAFLLISFMSVNAGVTHRLTHTNDSTYLLEADASYNKNDFEWPITYTVSQAKHLILKGDFSASDLGLMIYFNKAFFSCFKTIDMTDCSIIAVTTSYHPERYQGGSQVSLAFEANYLPPYCFYYNTNLTKLTLPKTCTKVSSICVNPSTIKEIAITNTTTVLWSKSYSSDSLFLITDKEKAYETRLQKKDSVILSVPNKFFKNYRYSYKCWSDVKIVGYDTNTTSVNETLEKPSINVFPTVTSGILNISGLDSGNITILDLSGNVLLSEKPQAQIDISSFNKGIYLVKVNNKITKIIKQ